ncbi:MAG: hypothetical protein QM736_10505 [Vicinamibacterales bacterium]
MDSRLTAALAIVGALAIWALWYIARALWIRRRVGGDRVVTCPADGQSALVHVDVALAVTGDAGSMPAPLESCSRWADHGTCDQPCCQTAHASSSSPAAIVRAWVQGRSCVSCGAPLAEPRFAGHHVALLDPSGVTREWVDIAADRLPLALATSLPVCWNCHVAEKFRRMHPELVIDRDASTVQTKDE